MDEKGNQDFDTGTCISSASIQRFDGSPAHIGDRIMPERQRSYIGSKYESTTYNTTKTTSADLVLDWRSCHYDTNHRF